MTRVQCIENLIFQLRIHIYMYMYMYSTLFGSKLLVGHIFDE